MSLPKFRYAVLSGVVCGLVVPLFVMVLFWLRVFHIAGTWLLLVWPSSIMLMATETLGHSLQALAILAWSIAWNVLLFTFIWCVGWVLRAWRTSLRDGTTI
jgi:hypothetical protein